MYLLYNYIDVLPTEKSFAQNNITSCTQAAIFYIWICVLRGTPHRVFTAFIAGINDFYLRLGRIAVKFRIKSSRILYCVACFG